MSILKVPLEVPEGYQVIFVASITLKNRKKIFASTYGKKAFPLVVKAK